MAKVIGKDKPRGKDRGRLKSKLKKKILVEEKKEKRRAEVKRQNSEKRKEKEKFEDIKNMVSQVEIIGFKRGIFTVKIDGKEEKRVLKLKKDSQFKEGQGFILENAELKLFGSYFKIVDIKGLNRVIAEVEEYLLNKK